MILPGILLSVVLLALLLIASNHLIQTRRTIMQRIGSWVVIVIVLVVGSLLVLRYWTVRAISCAPSCIGENLLGRDLQGATLRHSNFMEANLRGANLSNADLYDANFLGANLASVNLQNANMKGAQLVGATLTKADLRGVQLGDTDLRGADLSQSDLTQADLTKVHLAGVVFTGAKLVEANLRGKNLAGVNFVNADLTGADLTGSDLSGSRLSGANLSGAQLTGANLAGSWLNLSNMTGVNLTEANLAGANLIGANLASANLSGSRLVDADLIGAHVNGANVRAADLTGVRLLADELAPIDLLTDPILQQLNELQLGQVIADVDLSGVSFNRETKWPLGHTSLLAKMLGQRFFDYSLNTANNESATVETTMTMVGSAALMSLTQAVYSLFIQTGRTQRILVDSIDPDIAFTLICTTENTDIVMAHRPASAEESALCKQNGHELVEFTVGLQAFVIVVNPQNQFLNDVTVAELNTIALAERWSDVNLDWPRADIGRYVPDSSSVSFRFWGERLFGENITAVGEAPHTTPSGNAAQLVQGIVNDPYALGVLDYAFYKQNAGGLKLVSINKVLPTIQTVGDGSYILAQPLYLYVDKLRLQRVLPLNNFLTFYIEQAELVAPQVGLFPAPAAMKEEAKRKLLIPKTQYGAKKP